MATWEDAIGTFPSRGTLAGEQLSTGPHSKRHADITTALDAWLRDAQNSLGGYDSFADAFLARTSGNFVNVKAAPYGAVGDNSTNDTAAIQAAIDLCAFLGGGTVFLPSGTYAVTTLLVKTGVQLVGAGVGATTVRGTSSIANVIHFAGTLDPGDPGNGATHVRNAGLHHMSIRGSTLSTGILCEHSSSLTLTNFRVDNVLVGLRGFGWWDSHVWGDWRIQECHIAISLESVNPDPILGVVVDTNCIKFDGGTCESNFANDVIITGSGQRPGLIKFAKTKFETAFCEDQPRIALTTPQTVVFDTCHFLWNGFHTGYSLGTTGAIDGIYMEDCVGCAIINPTFLNRDGAIVIDNFVVFDGTSNCTLRDPVFVLNEVPVTSHIKFVGTNRGVDYPVDGQESEAGGWIFNNLTISGVPTTTRQTYVRADGRVEMQGDLVLLDGFPAASTDYVDNASVGLSWKDAVRVATTANITLSGTQTIDGVAVVADDRVLVKNQTTAAQNGIYDAKSGAWVRADDMNVGSEFPGAAVLVISGTANASTAWVCTNTSPPTVGTTAVTFSQFSGGVGTLAGDVTGAVGANTVTKIRGTGVSTVAPAAGDALVFDGTNWGPVATVRYVSGLTAGSTGAAAGNVTKIQAALDAAEAAGGGVVQLPASTESSPFYVNATILIGEGVTLRGAGWKATWLTQAPGSNLDAVVATKPWYNNTAAGSIVGAAIEYVAVDYNWRAPTTTSATNITVSGIASDTLTIPTNATFQTGDAVRFSTTLNDAGGISSSDTTINVVSTVGVAAGQMIRIESELIKIGTVASATQYTGCTRGACRTTAATHADGVAITAGQPQYAIRLSNTTLKLAASYRDAIAGTALTISGSGTIKIQMGYQRNVPSGATGGSPTTAHGHGIAFGGAFAGTINRCHIQNCHGNGIFADGKGRDRTTDLGRGNQLRIQDNFVSFLGSNGIMVIDVDCSDGFMLRNVVTSPNGQGWNNTGSNADFGHHFYSVANGWTIQGNHGWTEWAENTGWSAWGNGQPKHGFRLSSIGGGRIYGNKAANFGYSNVPGTYCGFELRMGDDRATDFFGNDVSGAEPHGDDSSYTYIAYRLYSSTAGFKSTLAASGNTVKMRDPDNGPTPGLPSVTKVWGFNGASGALITANISGTTVYNTADYVHYAGSPTLNVTFDGTWLSTTSSAAVAAANATLINAQISAIAGFDVTATPTTVSSGSNGVNTSTFTGAGTLNVGSTTNLPDAGSVCVAVDDPNDPGNDIAVEIAYTAKTATTLTGCSRTTGTGTLATGDKVYPLPVRGGRVELPASTADAPFEISSAIIIPNGIELAGKGRNRTYLKQRAGSDLDAMIASYYWWHNCTRALTSGGKDDGIFGATVRGMTLDCNHMDWDNATTLTADITNSATSIPVASRSGIAANDVIRIDNEMFTVTASGSGAGNLTVASRATESNRKGTAAASHLSGAKVSVVRNLSTTNARTATIVADGHGIVYGCPSRSQIVDVEILRPYGCGVFFDDLGRDRSTPMGFGIQWHIERLWVKYPGMCGYHNAGALNDGHVTDFYLDNVNQLDLNTATAASGDADYGNTFYGHYVFEKDGGGTVYKGGHGYGNYAQGGNTAFPGSRCKNGLWIRSAAARIIGVMVTDFGQGTNDGVGTTYYGIYVACYYKRSTQIVGCKVHPDLDSNLHTKWCFRVQTQMAAGTSSDFAMVGCSASARTDTARAAVPAVDPATTLNGSLTSSTTTIVVTSASGPVPLAAGDVILVEDECIRLGTKSTNTFSNCVRGWANTVPAAHATAENVFRMSVNGLQLNRSTATGILSGAISGNSLRMVGIPFDGQNADASGRVKISGNSWQHAGTVPPTAGAAGTHGYVPLGYRIENDCSVVTNVSHWVCTTAGTTDSATFTAF